MSAGCFIVIYKTGDAQGNVEPLTMHNFGGSKISSMISKENLFSLQMRYIDSSEQLLYGHQIINGVRPNIKLDEWSINQAKIQNTKTKEAQKIKLKFSMTLSN